MTPPLQERKRLELLLEEAMPYIDEVYLPSMIGMGHRREDVEDAIQSALMTATEKFSDYDPGLTDSKRPFANWVCVMATRKLIDAWRKKAALISKGLATVSLSLFDPEEPAFAAELPSWKTFSPIVEAIHHVVRKYQYHPDINIANGCSALRALLEVFQTVDRWARGFPLAAMSKRIGKSRQTVSVYLTREFMLDGVKMTIIDLVRVVHDEMLNRRLDFLL